MDILKLLNETKFIDCDPASDIEEEKDRVVYSTKETSNSDKKEKGKKTVKRRAVLVQKDIDEETSIETIIEEKPSKKVIEKYIKMRIQSILDEDD